MLPQDFRVKDWQETASFDAPCMENGTPCDIFVLPGTPAPTLIIHRTNAPSPEDSALVYTRDPAGAWHRTGTLNNLRCPAVTAALREGKAAPVRPPYDDLMAAGIRLEMTPERGFGPDPCPEPQPKPQLAPTPKPSDANAPARMGPAFGNPGPG